VVFAGAVRGLKVTGVLAALVDGLECSSATARGASSYTIDQGSPCPLATLNPFGRELLLSDVSTGIKWSTWIERSIMYMIINMIMNITSYN
jgi:hypothetical protein